MLSGTHAHISCCRVLLERGGVLPQHIHDDMVVDRPGVTPCTSCHAQDFFSHVRDGPDFGTQLGFLWIRDGGADGTSSHQPVERT